MRILLLLQCTIPYVDDDWHAGRFALLAGELQKTANVGARNLVSSESVVRRVLPRLRPMDAGRGAAP